MRMPTFTRRTIPALLAGLLGSASAPALAQEEADPVFAALDAYAQARAENEMAHDHLWALEEAHRDVAFYKPRVPVGVLHELEIEGVRPARTEVQYAHSAAEIRISFWGGDREAKIAERIAALEEDRRRNEAEKQSLGLVEAEEAAAAAADRLYEAEVAVLETVPTTLAGARALAQFAAHAHEERGAGEDTLAPLRGLFAFLTTRAA